MAALRLLLLFVLVLMLLFVFAFVFCGVAFVVGDDVSGAYASHAGFQTIERLQRDVDRLSFDRELMLQETAEAKRQCAEMVQELKRTKREVS